jgi:cytochrome c-type biogenesis protein CcmH/NrfG
MATDHSTAGKEPKLSAAIALLAAVAAATPCFFSRGESLRSAVAGHADHANLIDRFIAIAFRIGGLPTADLARATCVALPIFVLFFTLGRLLRKLPPHLQAGARRVLTVAALGTIAFGTYESVKARQHQLRDIRLLAPIELLREGERSQGRIFMNPSALAASRLLAPGLIPQAPDSPSAQALSASPVRWREEDRSKPFSAVLLATPLDDCRPLVDLLSSSPEWRLARIDNMGVLYKRGQNESTNPISQTNFTKNRDEAVRNAQLAMILHFLGKNQEAREFMDMARRIAPRDPLVLTQSATLAASFKQWQRTREAAELALKENPSSLQAHYLLALAFLEMKNIPAAAAESGVLASFNSSDPSVLLLQARIAREANDPTTEISALEKLLTISKKRMADPAIIHIHLAQAWAKKGFSAQALENYTAALEGDLTPAQRAEVERARGTIKDRAPRLD